MRKIVIALLSMSLAATWPCAAHAQFGSGIVYDPTQSAHAITQIEHETQSINNQMQQIENGQQIFTNTVKIASTALQTYNQVVQQYNLYHQMVLAPQTLYSRFLSPATDLRMLQQISNTYGNSAGWVNSANTGSGAVASYQQVSVPHTNNVIPGYSTASVAGQQQIAAQGAAPSITAMGTHIVLALATIMLVWFGVQESLASANGGQGFSMARFLNLFMLLTFAYVMVAYYDSSIPGLGFSLKGLIDGGTANLVNLIGADGSASMLNEIHSASSKTGPSMLSSIMSPYYAIVYFVVQFLLAVLAAVVSAILAYGAVASTHHRPIRPALHSFPCLRQTRLAVLGMVENISRLQLLQSDCRGCHECSFPCADELLCPAWAKRFRSFTDRPDLAAADSACTGQRLHPLQDSIHVAQLVRQRRWGWRRTGHVGNGNSRNGVGPLQEKRNEH